MKKVREFLGKKLEEQTISRKNKKTETARGLGKRTREEIRKRNQMTVPRFQTGG